MHKGDVLGKLCHHGVDVVVSPCGVRAHTKREAIMDRWLSCQKGSDVCGCRHNARQPKEWDGWVVRMYRHVYACLLGNRNNLSQKVRKVRLDIRLCDASIFVER